VPLGPPLTVIVFGDIWEPAGYAAIAMCGYAGASAITATVAELLKADGNTAPLTRINLVITLVTAAAMLALVPLGLSATAAGLSIGAAAGAAYALRTSMGHLGAAGGTVLHEIWAPALAATVMALAVLPIDRLLLEPAEHSLVLGILLLLAEGLLCAAIFAATLSLLAPSLLTEVRGALARLRPGGEEPVGPSEAAYPDPPAWDIDL
jgi:O-antigen/teichoic acid export membrane protein